MTGQCLEAKSTSALCQSFTFFQLSDLSHALVFKKLVHPAPMVSCQIPHKRNSIKYENLNIKQRQDAHHCMACLPSWNYQQALRMPLDEVLP